MRRKIDVPAKSRGIDLMLEFHLGIELLWNFFFHFYIIYMQNISITFMLPHYIGLSTPTSSVTPAAACFLSTDRSLWSLVLKPSPPLFSNPFSRLPIPDSRPLSQPSVKMSARRAWNLLIIRLNLLPRIFRAFLAGVSGWKSACTKLMRV